VRGIPTLVFVDAEGNTLTKDGRAVVMEDPQGARFPWAPKSFAEILGTSFIDNKKNKFTAEHLKGKVLGLYFSAHWCGPCRGFTPTLVQLYNKLKVAGKPFEIIFVSSDRDEASFDEYFNSMPWLALDPADGKDARKAELSSHFEVDGIPTLVILDENHKIITSEGRGAVSSDPEGAEFPWLPKPLNALDDSAQSVINDFPFLVAETDGSPEAIAAAKAAVADAAEAEFAKASPRLKFFYLQDPDEGIYDAIRRFAQITKEKLYIVSAQTQKKYIAPSQEITKANVDAFVQAFYDGKLEAVALR
jgi:nucleoredoxin